MLGRLLSERARRCVNVHNAAAHCLIVPCAHSSPKEAVLRGFGRTLGLAAGLFSLAALAAGADGSWTQCAAPARLTPDPAGRLFHVATWGTNPGYCPAPGYTFRTIDAAAKCAQGRDTIYVHNGTYGPVLIMNLWPSAQVLITNAPGENPIIDGWGGIADYAAVLGLWQVTNFAIQGREVRNTGVP